MPSENHIIATWPDGTVLSRLNISSDWGVSEEVVFWKINNPSLWMDSVLLSITLKNLDRDQPHIARSPMLLRRGLPESARRDTDGPTAVPGPIRRATVWTIVELLRQPTWVCRRLDALPFPGIISNNPIVPTHRGVLESKNLWAMASLYTPPTKRAVEWIRSSQALLTRLDALKMPNILPRDLETGDPLEVRWEISGFLHGGPVFTVVMIVPPLQQIERGSLPVWSVYSGEYATKSDLPPDPLSSTDQGIYPALSEAGILVLDTDYDAWVEANSSPGNLVEDLSMYQLLGVRIPYLLPESEFQEWLTGKDL